MVPLAVGGDHSVTLPVLRALVSDEPVGLIHIDAHTDTWDEFMGSRYSHGAPFRRAVEERLIDPQRPAAKSSLVYFHNTTAAKAAPAFSTVCSAATLSTRSIA